MLNKINIFVYSYKNKNLLNNIKDIYNKSSKKNDLKIFICDQNNLNRSNAFNSLNYTKYKHISWDSVVPFYEFRDGILNTDFDYYLEIGDNVCLINNWDTFLINYLKNKNNVVLSGNKNVKIYIEKNKIKKKYFKNNDFKITNFIDLNFIFMKKENVKILKKCYLRFYNKDLLLSLLFFNNFITIYAVPDNIYVDNPQSFLNNSYVPYSLYENYNLAVNYIKNNNCNNFMNYHDINLKNIKKNKEKIINKKYHYQDYLMDNNETRFIKNSKSIFTKTFIKDNGL